MMRITMLCRMVDTRVTLAFEVLSGWGARMRGLLGPRARGRNVALVGCPSVHTFGMRYPIDVALVSRMGKVLVSRRNVVPGRIVSAPGAWVALERPANEGPWPQEGSWVSLANVSNADCKGMEGYCV